MMTIEQAQPGEPSIGAPTEAPQSGPSNEDILAGMKDLTGSNEEAPAEEQSTAQEEDAEQAEKIESKSSEDTPPPKEEPADPQVERRIEAIRQEERRAREALAAERERLLADIQAERAKLEEERSQGSSKMASLEERAAYDPAGALMALGWAEDQLESAARQVYAASPAAQKDPKTRGTGAAEIRARKIETRLETLERENRELREAQASREKAEQQRAIEMENSRRVEGYLGKVRSHVGDETPIVSRILEKNPEKANRLFAEVAESLLANTGEVPDPVDVARELEKRQIAELEERGIDVSQISRNNKKPPTQFAGEQRAARTLTSDLSTPTPPKAEQLTDGDLDEDILRALKSGRFD